MALLTFVCKNCGHKQEEIVRSGDKPPLCEKCGSPTEQCFSGKCYGSIGGVTSTECTHHCSTCSGCKK